MIIDLKYCIYCDLELNLILCNTKLYFCFLFHQSAMVPKILVLVCTVCKFPPGLKWSSYGTEVMYTTMTNVLPCGNVQCVQYCMLMVREVTLDIFFPQVLEVNS